MISFRQVLLASVITSCSALIFSGCSSSDSPKKPEETKDTPVPVIDPPPLKPVDPPVTKPTINLSFKEGEDIPLLNPEFSFNIDVFNVQQHILDNGYFAFTWVKSPGTYFYDKDLTEAYVEMKISSPDGVTQYPVRNVSGRSPETSPDYQTNKLDNSKIHFSFAQKSTRTTYLAQFQRDYTDLDDVIFGTTDLLFTIPNLSGDTVINSQTIFGGNRKIDFVVTKKKSKLVQERLFETLNDTDYFQLQDEDTFISSIAANRSEQAVLVSYSLKSDFELFVERNNVRIVSPPPCCRRGFRIFIPFDKEYFTVLDYREADNATPLRDVKPVRLPFPNLTYKFVQTRTLLADNGDVAISFYAYEFLAGNSGTNASYKVVPGIMSKTAGSDTFNYYTFDAFNQVVGLDGNGEVVLLKAPKMVEHNGKILMLLTNFHQELNEAMVVSTDKLKLGIVNAAFGQAPGIKTLDTEFNVANIYDELKFVASKSLTNPAIITALYRNDANSSDSSDTPKSSEILGFSIDKDYAPQVAEVIQSYSTDLMWEMNLSFGDKGTPETDDDFYLFSWLTKTKDETLTQLTDEFRKFRFNIWFNTLDVESKAE